MKRAGPRTFWIYANLRKQVGDKDHLKVLKNAKSPKRGLRRTIREVVHLKKVSQ